MKQKKAHNNIGKQTSKVYEDYIRKYIIPYIGGIYISDITKIDIHNKIINKMNSSDYAPATIGKTVRILKTSLDYAVDFELIKKIPCVKLILPQKEKSKSEIKVWKIGEVKTFLSIAKEYQYYSVFHLGLNTGMRQQEILGFSWDNVNFEKSTINIRQVLSHDGKEIINSTKTENSERTINVSDSTMNLLMNSSTK